MARPAPLSLLDHFLPDLSLSPRFALLSAPCPLPQPLSPSIHLFLPPTPMPPVPLTASIYFKQQQPPVTVRIPTIKHSPHTRPPQVPGHLASGLTHLARTGCVICRVKYRRKRSPLVQKSQKRLSAFLRSLTLDQAQVEPNSSALGSLGLGGAGHWWVSADPQRCQGPIRS